MPTETGELTVFDPSPARAAGANHRRIIAWLMGGTPAIRAAGAEIFPILKGEQPADHQQRIGRAVMRVPAYARAMRDLTGKVFAQDPKLAADVPEEIRGLEESKGKPGVEGLWEDLDLTGNNGPEFFKAVFLEALAYGDAGVLVDHPPRKAGTNPDQVSKDEEKGRRPYGVIVHPDNILEDRWDLVDGERVRSRVRILEPHGHKLPAGDWGEKSHPQVRVLYRGDPTKGSGDPAHYVWREIWRMAPDKKPYLVTEPASDGPRALRPLTEIPFSILPEGGCEPLLMDLAYLNLHYLDQWSQFEERFRVVRTPILLYTGAEIDKDGKFVALERFQRLAGRGVFMTTKPPSETGLTPIEFNGSAVNLAWQDMLDLQKEMQLESLKPLLKDRPQTATERLSDQAEADSALQTKARQLQNFIENVLMDFAAWRKLPSGGSAQVSLDFGPDEAQTAVLASAGTAVGLGALSRKTYRKVLAWQRALPPEINLEEEEELLAEEAAGSAGGDVEELRAMVEDLAARVTSLTKEAQPLPEPPAAPPAN